ncbi:YfhE family protein [Planomicrobium sp. CPCC 101079]|uniref:YfhE family protein n=1 Tax=Planomicrobium sp. CPCC 101079 TaxID=2599618 RepID=UPI0011B66229|nr:YfhE family protein [Planomicrobium sp. CPCC 101079]TWT02367.1 YfhE family protein [Planomicrobium sp. CPCC 101079]
MSNNKEPHEQLAKDELDLKAAQKVNYADDFKKADQAGKEQDDQGEKDDAEK